MSKLTTLERILDKKQKNNIDEKNEVVYKSKTLGTDIVIQKKPLSTFMDVAKDAEGENEIMMYNYLLHAYLPMFQEPDGVKAALEYYRDQGYKIATPRELPEYVFEGDIGEMHEIVEIISSFYNFDKLEDDIKN